MYVFPISLFVKENVIFLKKLEPLGAFWIDLKKVWNTFFNWFSFHKNDKI